jgi:hypothetical protein
MVKVEGFKGSTRGAANCAQGGLAPQALIRVDDSVFGFEDTAACFLSGNTNANERTNERSADYSCLIFSPVILRSG